MRTYLKIAAGAALGAGMLALTAGTASAAVACNENGTCWHVRSHYAYPPEARVVIHPEGWRWGPREHYTWREHPGRGRGYWRSGVWVRF